MKKSSLKRKADNSDDDSASENELDALIGSSDDDVMNNVESCEDDDDDDDAINEISFSKGKDKKAKKIRVDKKEGKTPFNKGKNTKDTKPKDLVKNHKNDKSAQKKDACNEGTSVFIKCRHFSKVSPVEFKKMLTEKGFEVKAVYKHPPFSQFGFIDLGSEEAVEKVVALFHTTKMHGQIVIASSMKSKHVTQQERVAKEAKLQPITLADRIMYIRNIPFMTSKKNLQDIFPKVDTVIIPPCKGNALRDAILIFASSTHLESAFELAEGCEYMGHKLSLERIITTAFSKITNGPNDKDKESNAPDMKKSKKSKKLNKTK